jgi:hypothetical protein
MADRAQIPGKNGGYCEKIFFCRLCPAPQTEHSSLSPAAQRRWIGQAGRIFAVGRCLFHRVAGGNPFTGLLSTTQAVVPKRNQPVGQDCEGLVALPAKSAANPQAYMPVIVCLPEPLAMTDDPGRPTNWTPARQAIQRNYPGSMLSSASGSAITRIRLA